MIFKRIGAICFALAFILAIGVFTNYFSAFISKPNAKIGIIICGGIALLMNLLAFRYDPNSESNNLVFWLGTVIIFIGLIFKIQNRHYDQYILIAGIFVVALSYFFNPFKKSEEPDDDLLDN
ncbi:MAG: hypothetical protein ACO1O6_05950 [Bacteroidota bacterium]